jgi:cell division protein FtsW (lipid II flippase)
MRAARRRIEVLQRVDGWLVLAIVGLCLCGLLFIGSATSDDALFEAQQGRQALFVACGLGVGFFAILPHYVHILRLAWVFYGIALVGLCGLGSRSRARSSSPIPNAAPTTSWSASSRGGSARRPTPASR